MSIGSKPALLGDRKPPRRRHLYEGRTKTLFDGPDPGTFVLYFKDNCKKQDGVSVIGKGVINNRLSEMFMVRLNEIGVQTHLIRRLNMREQLVRATQNLPCHVIVHNLAIDNFAKRLGLEEGMLLPEAIPEFHVKSKDYAESVISERHITALGWADEDELDCIKEMTQRINDFLCGQFIALGLRLIRYQLEFGRVYLSDYMGDTQIVLIDEISADSCCVLDIESGERLDIDSLSGEDLGHCDQRSRYQKLAEKFGLLKAGGPADLLIREEIL
ncbi:phosphoribosylaminoimidazolesuccinocarboxamide synthase [Candidatus Finniella inopinata]|uniref:Phosphoribosylaminoimidazole-succinocarboxamide synthase n=1 Tax=Candidatus Finniella inopinata TaxID=1696036 RepID=A0A4V2DZW0_9PROT|nr:phosphoribosylaminoimidazolesuccinocarboxamide synthase [Candidatus Finniella inopinata]RZI46427.1 phosphoribosylaminoimidazolesuccinocarboxamide synthase [Candidatus Finniella inopinata]